MEIGARRDRPIELSICIVTWNVKDYLKGCLESIRDCEMARPYEILVVDNNSRDGTVTMAKEGFPEVRLLVNAENTGFPRACNQAIRESRGTFVLLLNPDTVVHRGAPTGLTAALDADPRAGAAGPLILKADGTPQEECYRDLPGLFKEFLLITGLHRLFSYSRIAGAWHGPDTSGPGPVEIEAGSGACLMLRRDALLDVGELDERSFMHLEDVDLCLRLRKRGWKILFAPEARITHYGMGSSLKVLPRIRAMAYESRYKFFRIHRGRARAELFRLMVLLGMAARLGAWGPTLADPRPGPRRRSRAKLEEILRALRWSVTLEDTVVPDE